MTKKPVQTATKSSTPRSPASRQSITFELVARLAPHQGLADNLVRTFGLDPVDYTAIRDATEEHMICAAKAFGEALNDKALQIHLQRITGAFVGSAFGAAQFYGTKMSAAMELTSKLLNDDRDEDRDGPSGFESKAERARLFAAEMAAAEGAIAAYVDLTGDEWKPYETPYRPSRHGFPQISRRRNGGFPVKQTTQARAEPSRVPPSDDREAGSAGGLVPMLSHVQGGQKQTWHVRLRRTGRLGREALPSRTAPAGFAGSHIGRVKSAQPDQQSKPVSNQPTACSTLDRSSRLIASISAPIG